MVPVVRVLWARKLAVVAVDKQLMSRKIRLIESRMRRWRGVAGDVSSICMGQFISEVFRNEEIGLEQMDEEVHRVFFCNTELGEFNSAEMRFRQAIRSEPPKQVL